MVNPRKLLLSTLIFVSNVAMAEGFTATCQAVEITPLKMAPAPLRIEWDGRTLTIDAADIGGKSNRTKETILAAKRLVPRGVNGHKMSFLTDVHPTRNYKYYTTVDFSRNELGGDLELMFATTDSEGFPISVFSAAHRQCNLTLQ